jgi:hypothetical protein
MKLLHIIIFLAILLSSCKNEKTKNTAGGEPVNDKITEAPINSEDTEYPYNLHSIWAFDYMKDTVIQIHRVNRDTLSPELLVNLLNLDFSDKVHCEFVKIHNDTAFVRIPDSEYLTQRMGTTGAYEYMIAATFTITELDEIEFVNFDFEYGDHAVPGTYTRRQFIDEIEYNKSLNK